MRILTIILLFSVLAFGCSKNDVDNNVPNDPNDTTNNNPSYTQIKGDWNWIGKDFIHVPSNFGRLYQAWPLNGGIYCYWREDIGAQYINRVSYYNGTNWTNLYQDLNADAQIDFAVHNGELYQFATDVDGSYTLKYTDGLATYIDTANWPNFTHNAYLASDGNDLVRIVSDYGTVQGSLTFETWDGNEWVTTDSAITINGLPNGYAWSCNGTGKIYFMVNESATDRFEIYSYAGTGTLTTVATVNYGFAGGGYAPKLFDYNGNLHIMSTRNNTPDARYRTIVEVTSSGTINTVLNLTSADSFLIEAFPSPQGIIYTKGITYANVLTTLTDIFVLNNSSTKRYSVTIDDESRDAINNQALGMGMLREGGIYNGGVYFYYNGSLHCVGNAHLGSQLGTAATKVFLAKYNEE